MSRSISDSSDLFSLQQVSDLLRRAHKPRHPQSLYDRIRRGTLIGVQQAGKWYIPREQVDKLLRSPYHRHGGRPRIQDTETFVRSKPRRRVDIPDVAEVARLVHLSVEQRTALAFQSHAIVRNTIRAHLAARYPELSPCELGLRVVAELNRG